MSVAGSPAVTDSVKIESASFLATLFNHPIGFWFIFWGEFAERCSYYGMRAILAVYMHRQLGMSQEDAGTFYSFFIAGCYLLPLAGGFIADNYFGKYNTIVFFSIPYIAGHFVLGIEDRFFMFVALVLLAMGSGVIKPNISTLMGMTYDQFRPGQEQLRSNAFSIFYMSINIGAAISQIMVPWIRTRYNSYFYAFLFPAVLMVVALLAFAAGKPFYAKEVIGRTRSTPEEKKLQWQVVFQLAGLFLLVTFFWAIFDQSSSTWIFYAYTYMDCNVFGFDIDPEQVQALNPILIVIMVPMTMLLWTYLDNIGWRIRPTSKMMLGFALTAACMATMAAAGYSTGKAEKRDMVKDGAVVRDADGQPKQEDFCPPERKVSVGWQMLAYLFITIAEILISVTGLELAFTAAPKSMKSFITGMWLLTVFLANFFINAPLSRVYPSMHPGHYFAMLTTLMLVVTALFYLVARRFNRIASEMDEASKQAALAGAGGGPLDADAALSADAATGVMDKSRREGIVDRDQKS